MPTFTTLKNLQPPEWSTFSKLNKAKERHVPLNVEHDLPERGRERAKTSSSGTTSKEDSKSQKPQSRSSSAKKNTVCILGILFSSNHNIHKNAFDLYS